MAKPIATVTTVVGLAAALCGCYTTTPPGSYKCSSAAPQCPDGYECVDESCIPEGNCPDGVKNGREQCDGTDFGTQTCQSFCLGPGKLACNTDCTIDKTGCSLPGWISLKPGAFTMGSPASENCRESDETVHQVTLTRAFEISATEVTQKQFIALMGYNSTYYKTNDERPVDQVNWHRAVSYCNALSVKKGLTPCYVDKGQGKSCTPAHYESLCPHNEACLEKTCARFETAPAYSGKAIYDCPGYRLPTEAEWEYAYRAGTNTALYSGPLASCDGEDTRLSQIAWYRFNSGYLTGVRSRPAATKLPNKSCLFDMSGNLWEWTHDGYGSLEATKVTDPVGPDPAIYRVLRGGSTARHPRDGRGARRFMYDARKQHAEVGLRCVRTLP